MQCLARKDQKRNHGFALLVTIVLVAFLVLILVGLATFTRVETQVSDNAQQLAKARQNALSSLNLALGQLQRYAGPDTQITARSEIVAVAPPTQRFLTGTWDNTGVLNSWLVSGNENDPVGAGSGITPATALNPATGTFPVDDTANRVYVVASNSVASNADGVLLAKQTINAPAGSVPGFTTTQPIGHYAWWVGDEGVKASASLVDDLQTANAINYDNSVGPDPVKDDWFTDAVKKERLNQFGLSRPRTEKVLAGVDPDLAANVIALPKVVERTQFGFLTGAPATLVLKGSFHDLTPLSLGVLADTSTGRLRNDLSASTGTAGAKTSFQLLRPDATTALVADFFPATSTAAVAGAWPTFGVIPVVSEAGIRLYFTVAGGQVVLNYLLEAEIWNPYSARLITDATHTLRFSVTFPTAVNFKVQDSSGPTSQTVSIAAGTTYSANLDTAAIWDPGIVQRFRGGSVLKVFSAGEPAATANLAGATVTTIDTVDAESAVANLKFDLELVDTGTSVVSSLQSLTLGSSFSTEIGIANSGIAPALGYGYEFNRDFRVWSEGTQTESRDPRLPVMSGVNFQEITASQWTLATPSSNASAGFATGDITDAGRVLLFDLPRQEVTNVAQLRHLIGAKSYELGSAWGTAAGLNNLFDSDFVSTVPRNFAWPVDGSSPRPNRYLEIYRPEGVAAGTITDLRNAANSARYQLVRGAFNINSTSVNAWKAVLGSKLSGWDHLGAAGAGIALDNVFFRTEHGAQQRTALSGTIPPVPNTTDLATLSDVQMLGASGRQLLDANVDLLAAQIVAQLKARGRPFGSLADFVKDGLVQRAIDAAALNTGITNANLRYTAAALTQADVIACIAPFMAARSDTFLVRAYGDVQNPATGTVEGRAWCEARVQRVPDLVSDPAAAVGVVLNPPAATNPFGRRFKIISFRWLTPGDL